MVLENLALLDAAMRVAGCRSVRFNARCDGLQLAVVYLNDVCPQELLILRQEPRQWMRVPVQQGHQLEAVMLRPLIQGNVPPDTPISPGVRRFLETFALAVPRTLAEVERIGHEVILQHSFDVEEPAKIYFAGWQPQAAIRPGHPNLQKTRRAFGQDAYELCLHLQIGGRWTEDAAERQEFKLPE